ncbi:hypothetical protein AJ79_00837 [Helicocarpus griseus UAMH5409]|uniref:Yeast cell wall synthesis Kre9/Knh1-like N-terminal domain-containing protein n=1 Tax=Helicocarpus griseus UAMH5409 TaxID=1447875 RepID=A0A2B7YAJ2_9EURO|nr:hypothetical protein AJ79_00837 [Helicocarpus griseus UAMH5409]
MKFTTTLVAAFVAVAAALTPADISKDPSGNPIAKPGLNELVPVGETYTITWEPTTPGKVSILLLRGPSNNVVPIETLADSIENDGTYDWTPSTSLEGDTTGYGLQIIVEGTGQYQYSTQFGIKNDKPVEPSGAYDVDPVPSATATASPSKSLVPIATSTFTICDCTETPAPTGGVPSTVVQPTAAPTLPSYAATPTPPAFEGAAGRKGAAFGGIVVAAAAAIFAF